jgi:hypothetical protein
MTTLIKIPIEEANNKQLLFFAQRVLGLDVAKGMNNATILAKIEAAMPGTTEIDVESEGEIAPASPASPTPPAAPPAPAAADDAIPAGREGAHFRYDPKVKIRVSATGDKTRAKDVQVAVNGDVIIIQRGVATAIPYRFYRALLEAVEKVGRETEEINPVTHMPIIEWVEQPSYEFSVLAMPSDEEIAAYHARTDAIATV